jgi:hypothetical protein
VVRTAATGASCRAATSLTATVARSTAEGWDPFSKADRRRDGTHGQDRPQREEVRVADHVDPGDRSFLERPVYRPVREEQQHEHAGDQGRHRPPSSQQPPGNEQNEGRSGDDDHERTDDVSPRDRIPNVLGIEEQDGERGEEERMQRPRRLPRGPGRHLPGNGEAAIPAGREASPTPTSARACGSRTPTVCATTA